MRKIKTLFLIIFFFNLNYSQDLIKAIKNNSTQEAIDLINSGADINNSIDKAETTPLICAVEHKNIKVIKLLLSRPNLDINKQTFSFKETALMKVCDTVSAQLLLARPDIDVNLINYQGNNALILLIIMNQIDIFKCLLFHPKIDITIQGQHRFDAVNFAKHCKPCNKEFYKLLTYYQYYKTRNLSPKIYDYLINNIVVPADIVNLINEYYPYMSFEEYFQITKKQYEKFNPESNQENLDDNIDNNCDTLCFNKKCLIN